MFLTNNSQIFCVITLYITFRKK